MAIFLHQLGFEIRNNEKQLIQVHYSVLYTKIHVTATKK